MRCISATVSKFIIARIWILERADDLEAMIPFLDKRKSIAFNVLTLMDTPALNIGDQVLWRSVVTYTQQLLHQTFYLTRLTDMRIYLAFLQFGKTDPQRSQWHWKWHSLKPRRSKELVSIRSFDTICMKISRPCVG